MGQRIVSYTAAFIPFLFNIIFFIYTIYPTREIEIQKCAIAQFITVHEYVAFLARARGTTTEMHKYTC